MPPTISVAPILSTSAVNLGRRDGTTTNFTGMWAEARAWSIECSGAQIAANYNQRITSPQSGLVAVWPGHTGLVSGNTRVIEIINSLHGILQGAASSIESTAPISN